MATAPESAGDLTLTQYTLDEIGEHWEMTSCWIVLFDFVYDVTTFLLEHPGGHEILMEHAERAGLLKMSSGL